ncbi:DNA helicase RecQ [Nitratireductor basaltis]|uniref:DNA helicase RecQ n=1 Tax=Nitratireductor basaltis TaxID=472175 RepID=A0A084UA59_9HYPH|nr:DNA helicase RecQ [Nitratireductor basaltis]KFB09845.1 ATP-dependent DNA helicase RecQ [Nitratireductor basaltis]
MAGDPLKILRSVYGYDAFRGQQEKIIRHVIEGNNAFVLMPTGGGKSLCYQIPALARPGMGLVISPLIALMLDQVTALGEAGVRAAALNSDLDGEARRALWRQIHAGELDLLYVAPETLMRDATLEGLRNVPLSLVAVDEAHCLSQWGHDFRPHYRALADLGQIFPATPRMALTATADTPTRAEIRSLLQIDEQDCFVAGFDRPNIRYTITEKADPRRQLLAFLNEHREESGIVYCLSKRKTEETAEWLGEQGYEAIAYHGGMDRAAREKAQHRFQREDGVVVVATIAFGMGIDKPDVRFVAHLDLPGSIEAYYQETGRAGRDGLPAEAMMLYGMGDVMQRNRFIEESDAPEARKHVERQKLDALLGLAETGHCRRKALLNYFDDDCEPCGNCDTCLNPPEMFDASIPAQMALSCMYRSGERFGQAHIIDILLGSRNEKVLANGHDKLSTYGIGKDYTRPIWRDILRQIIALRLIATDSAGHGGLHLTEKGVQFLKERPTLMLRKPRPKPVTNESAARSKRSALPEKHELVFQALREKRRQIAREQNIPPYVIFHDKVLIEMATTRPASRAELSRIAGIGETKLDRYGPAFLSVIAEHAAPVP